MEGLLLHQKTSEGIQFWKNTQTALVLPKIDILKLTKKGLRQ